MATNDCDKFSSDLLNTSGNYSPELKAHLQTCEECRMMAETWQALKEVKGKEPRPSKSLDFIIQREALRVSANRRTFTKSYTRWASLAAMAACAVFICYLAISNMRPRTVSQPNTPHLADNIPGALPVLNPAHTYPVKQQPKVTVANHDATDSQLSWDNLDLNDDFFELETEIEYCNASI